MRNGALLHAAPARVNVTLSVSRLALRVILRALFDDDLRQLVPDLDDNPFVAILQDARRDTRFAYEFRQLAREVKALVDSSARTAARAVRPAAVTARRQGRRHGRGHERR